MFYLSRKKSIYCIFFTFNTLCWAEALSAFCLFVDDYKDSGRVDNAMKRRDLFGEITVLSCNGIRHVEGHALSWPHTISGRDGARPAI